MRTLLSLFALAVLSAAHPLAQTAADQTTGGKAPVMINLNTATAAELETLPGIGARTAARIIEYRQKRGPFKKIEELMNVQGIGEKSFLRLRPQLTVGTPKDTAGQSQPRH